MRITTVTGREFNRNTADAKKAARNGPVFITERGRPAHVLLTIDEYRRLTGRRRNIADALAMPGGGDMEFEAPRAKIPIRPADLT